MIHYYCPLQDNADAFIESQQMSKEGKVCSHAIQPMCPPTRCLDATGGRASALLQGLFDGQEHESVNYPDEVIPSPRLLTNHSPSPSQPLDAHRLSITYCAELILDPRQTLSNLKILLGGLYPEDCKGEGPFAIEIKQRLCCVSEKL